MALKVILSPIGAKRALLQAFDAIAVQNGVEVVPADSDLRAPALIGRTTSIQTPVWTSSSWAVAFLKLCERHRPSLLVSLADKDLNALATVAPQLKAMDVQTLLPMHVNSVAICQDKRLFVQWCAKQGLPTPNTINFETRPPTTVQEVTQAFPLFARAAVGQSSVGSMVVPTPNMLAALAPMADTLIIQEMVTDPEYSIDVLSSFEGEALQAVVRRRLVVRGGESSTTQVVDNPDLGALAIKLCNSLGLVGHSVVQAFWSEQNGPRLIEVNPRFGGASTLSIRAGLDSPRRIIGMLRGDPAAYLNGPIQVGLVMHRVAEDVFVQHVERTLP